MVAERRFGEGGRDDAIYDIGNNSHFLSTGK
jgi:hypothetical protein